MFPWTHSWHKLVPSSMVHPGERWVRLPRQRQEQRAADSLDAQQAVKTMKQKVQEELTRDGIWSQLQLIVSPLGPQK